jgi:hypothetical protein
MENKKWLFEKRLVAIRDFAMTGSPECPHQTLK